MAHDSEDKAMNKRESDKWFDAVDAGVRQGVAMAIRRHKLAGRSIHVWRDGQIVEIPPEEIPSDDDAAENPAPQQ